MLKKILADIVYLSSKKNSICSFGSGRGGSSSTIHPEINHKYKVIWNNNGKEYSICVTNKKKNKITYLNYEDNGSYNDLIANYVFIQDLGECEDLLPEKKKSRRGESVSDLSATVVTEKETSIEIILNKNFINPYIDNDDNKKLFDLLYLIQFMIKFYLDAVHDLTEDRLKGTLTLANCLKDFMDAKENETGFWKDKSENWIKTNALSETAYAISIRLFYSYYDDINQYLIDLNITIKELIAFVNTLTYVDSDDKKLFNNLLKIFLSSNYETEFFNFYNEYVIGDKKYDTLKLCSRIIGIQTEHLQILIPDTGNQIDNYEQTKIMKYLEIITFNEQTSNYQINKNLFFSDDFIKDGITWTSLKFILECYANSLWNPNKYQVTYYYSDADYYDSGSPTSLLKTFMETLIPQVSNIFSVMKYSLSNNINNVLLNVGNTEFKLLSYKYETKRVGSKNITSLIIFNYFRTITTKELMDEGEKIAENNNKEVREIAESACETITNFEGKNSVKSILNNEYFSDNVLAGITIDSAANLSFLSGLKTLGDFGKQVSLMVLIKQQLADSVFAFFTGDTAFSQVSASLLGKYKNFKILNPKINYSMSGIFVGFKPMVEPMEEPAEEEMLLLNKYRDQYAEKYPEYYWEDDFSNGGVFDFGKKNNILSKINKDINYLKVLKVK